MSTTVDQRVVEMRFDNKNFENNVRTSMSTLEKLKQSLRLTGATKGMENIQKSANKMNSEMEYSSYRAGFHFQDVWLKASSIFEYQVAGRIINSAKKMFDALMIDPVKTGFQEYETQINAVQTILANTQSKGTTIDDVNVALDELNKYADKTIYNFTEMTRNIGTFTAAGVDLETSVNAIQGIANLAAVSGSTSQQAATAMYQLSQALSSGTVKLMDWNSVVNAGMGGQVFQDALKETARVHGIAIDSMIEEQGSFRETLSEGWLTSEILTETLQKFTLTTEGLTEAQIEQNREMLRSKGYTEEQIEEIFKLGATATDAATKVKTFTQLWDVLKESAQSGWSQTWKLIIGDFEEAKALLTPLADTLTGFINKMSDARNYIVQGVMDFASPWTNLMEKLENIQGVVKSVTNITDKLKYFQDVVNDVWMGRYNNWGDTPDRRDLLAAAGFDQRVVQELVNIGEETWHAGQVYQLTVEDIEAAHKKFGLTIEMTEEETEELNKALENLDEETLRNAGLTEDEIRLYKDLAKNAKKYGMTIDELATKMSETSGRDLLIESAKNIGGAFMDTFKAIGNAWGEIFEPASVVNIYMMLERFRDWTKTLRMVDEETGELTHTGKNLQNTFKGIFAIVDLITTIVGGGFKIAFKVVTTILKYFNLSILEVTGAIGGFIGKIHDWVTAFFDVTWLLDIVVPKIEMFIEFMKGLYTAFKNSETYQKIVDKFNGIIERFTGNIEKMDGLGTTVSDFFKKLFEPLMNIPSVQKFVDAIKEFIETLKSMDFNAEGAFDKIVESLKGAFERLKEIDLKAVGTFIFDGLIMGLVNGAKKIFTIIGSVAQGLIEKFCEILGIESPSKVFMALGGFIIAGLIAGISGGFITVPEAIQGIVDKCIGIFKSIDWGTIMALGISVTDIYLIKKIGDALENLTSPLEGLGECFIGFGRSLKAVAFNTNMKGLKQLAITIAILVGAIIALIQFGGDDYGKMWNAVAIIITLAAVLAGLSIAMNLLSKSALVMEKGKFSISGLKTGLLGMAAAIIIMAGVVAIIGKLNIGQAIQGFVGLGLIMAAMIGFIKLLQIVTKDGMDANIALIGGMMIKLAIAMGLMAIVCKMIGKLEPAVMFKAAIFAAAFAAFAIAIGSMAKTSGNNVSRFGGMMIKLAISMALMVMVCKMVDRLKLSAAIKGAAFALAFVGFVKLLVMSTRIGKKSQIAKIGGLLLAVSTSLMLMVGICKLVDLLTVSEIIKGAAFVAGFVILVKVLVSILTVGSETEMAKVTGTILAMSVSIAILATVCMLLSLLKIESLAKGVIAVSILCGMMALMAKSLKGAQNVSKSIYAMAITIAVLVASVAALSQIEDTAKLFSAVAAISVVLGMFALLVRSLKSMKGITGTVGPLLVLTATIAVIGGMLWLLAKTTENAQDNIANAIALSAVMLAMAGVIRIIGMMKLGTVTEVAGVILALTALAIPMAAFAFALRAMNGVENAIPNVIAISLLMAAMTGLLAVLNLLNMDKNLLKAGAGILALTLMVAPMATFIAMLAWMQNIKSAESNVAAICKLMWSMTGLLAILTGIGAIFVLTGGIGAVAAGAGILALTLMVAPMAAFIGMLAWMQNIEGATANATLLIGMMTIMTKLLTHLAIIGPFALIGVAALLALTLMMVVIGGLVVLIGGLNELTHGGLEKIIDSGLPLLIKLAEGIGQMIGKFIEAIGESIGNTLVNLGEDIASFMEWIALAADHASTIDPTSFDGVKTLIDVLGEIALTMVGTQIADWIVIGGDSIDKFCDDAIKFFGALKAISEEMTDFSLPAGFSAEAVKELLNILTAISANSAFNTGLDIFTKIFNFGKGGVEKFKEDAIGFFSALKEIATEMTGFSLPEGLNSQEITDLLGIIASVSSSSVGTSWKDAWTRLFNWDAGTDSMTEFKENAIAFFQALKDISAVAVGFSLPEDFSSKPITELLKVIDEVASGSKSTAWKDVWTPGGTTMEQFTKQSVDFFSALKTIAAEATSFALPEDFSAKPITELIDVIDTVAANSKSTAWKDIWTPGGTTMEQFETQGVAFFQALKGIADEAANVGVSTDSLDNIDPLVTKIKDLFKQLKDIDYSGVKEFTGIGTGGIGADGPLHDIGVAISDFAWQFADIDYRLIDAGATAATKIRTLISKLVGLDTSGISNFKAKEIGEKMAQFADQVKDIDGKLVTSAVDNALKLRDLISKLAGIDNSGVEAFSVKTIGEKMKEFANAVAGVDTSNITIMITAANRLKNFVNDLVGFDNSGISAFKTAVEELKTIFTDLLDIDTTGMENFNIKPIGKAIKSYNDSVADINPDIINSSISIATRLKNLITGLVGIDTSGINSFHPVSIANKIKAYSDTLGEVDSTALSNSVTVAYKFKDFITSLVGLDTSGLSSFDIKSIADKIKAYADTVLGVDTTAIFSSISMVRQLRDFVISLVGFDTSGIDLFKTSIDDIKGIFDGLIGIDTSGVDNFILGPIGRSIKEYSDYVAEIDTVRIGETLNLATRFKNFINNLSAGFDSSGAYLFNAEYIGKSIGKYYDYIDEVDMELISNSIYHALRLVSFIRNLAGLDSTTVELFKPDGIGASIRSYYWKIIDIDMDLIARSINTAISLKNFIIGLAGMDTSGITTFKEAIEGLATIDISAIADTFSDTKLKQFLSIGGDLMVQITDGMRNKEETLRNALSSILSGLVACSEVSDEIAGFKDEGENIIANLAKGVKKKSKLTVAFTTVLTDAKTAVRNWYDDFSKAGIYLVDGFAAGITAETFQAEAKAKAMAEAAYLAACEALGIASPSKEFYKIGEFTGMGLVNALIDYSGKVYDAGAEMADCAKKGLNNAINKVIDDLSGDMDMQPTIRPVLDLSNVESGVGAIGGMFKNGPSIGVSANLNAISSAMSSRNQNGVNNDIISAIDKLRNSLGNAGNTYVIDGITYDDGSNISEAVGDLMRAARIERRV